MLGKGVSVKAENRLVEGCGEATDDASVPYVTSWSSLPVCFLEFCSFASKVISRAWEKLFVTKLVVGKGQCLESVERLQEKMRSLY